MGLLEDILDKAGYGSDPSTGRRGGRSGRDVGAIADIQAALEANRNTDNRNWWENATGFVGDAVGGEWVPESWEDAWDATGGRALSAFGDAGQEVWQGDISGALGNLAGGAWDIGSDVARWGASELGEVGADLGRNIYSNWGLEDALGAAGRFGQSIPGMGLDAAQYLGGQGLDAAQWAGGELADLGQQGLGYLGGEIASLQDEAARLGQNLYGWGRDQAGNIADWTTQQAVPYFQQDFVGDVQNLYGGVKEWAVDDAWGQAIEPFYENVLKPAGIDIADWAVEDVYQDIITPLYENYLKPAGLEIADFTTQEAWPYIRDNLRHDISNVLEAVPAFVRNVAPEGSRVDDWLEGAVGGIGDLWNWGEALPGRAGGYLFDPSQPSWGQGGPASQAEVLEALIASAGGAGGSAAGGLGGAGALGGAAPSGVSAPGTGANVAGGMVPFPGGAPGAGAGFGSAGVPAGQPSLAEMYAAMYDRQRGAVEDQYRAGMAGAEQMGALGTAYADSLREQGRAAAAEAATAANAYFTEGVDEAARAYNETITALNSREQSLMDRYTEQAVMEGSGIMADSAEQRRIANDLSDLQRNRNTLRHQMVTGQLNTEEARRMTRLASDEAGLLTEVAQMESGRVGQEAALAAQLADRFSGARASTQKSIEDAEKALRDMGIEPAAYTAAPGAETQTLLTSQELSMQTMQNRLRDASAAEAIDRRARVGGIFSQAAQALQDKLFDMRSWADLSNFDAQADTDLAQAAALGEINLEELARLQASKESIFGKRTDLFDQGELERITTRKEYNAALEVERAAKRRSMEEAQRDRVAAEAVAANQAFQTEQNRLDRENALELERLRLQTALDDAEDVGEIATVEAALAENKRLSEEFINVTVNGVEIPVNREFYLEEVIFGDTGGDASSDVNLMQMQDDEGNTFYVDVGGVTEEGVPYLTHSAGTDLQLTGAPLTPVWAGEGVDAAALASGSATDVGGAPISLEAALTGNLISGATALENLDALLPGQHDVVGPGGATKTQAQAVRDFLATLG